MDKKVELAEQMLAEYEQVEANMASPEVLKSPAKMKSVGRRYAELGRVIRVYRQYKAAAEDLAEAKEIVEGGGEDAGRRGLPGAARACEQVRMANAVVRDGVLQRPRNMLLTDDIIEASGAVLEAEGNVGHL